MIANDEDRSSTDHRDVLHYDIIEFDSYREILVDVSCVGDTEVHCFDKTIVVSFAGDEQVIHFGEYNENTMELFENNGTLLIRC